MFHFKTIIGLLFKEHRVPFLTLAVCVTKPHCRHQVATLYIAKLANLIVDQPIFFQNLQFFQSLFHF